MVAWMYTHLGIRFGTTLTRALDNLLTFVKYPGMEPTNRRVREDAAQGGHPLYDTAAAGHHGGHENVWRADDLHADVAQEGAEPAKDAARDAQDDLN